MIAISLRFVKWLSVSVLALGLTGGLISPVTAHGAVPALPASLQETGTATGLSVFSVIKFSGTLKNSSGEPLTGTVGITFAFYPEQSGGAPLWLETQNVTLDGQGNYTALIGATKAEGLPLELFSSGEARWLGIQVGTEAEQPRILLVSVPYALKAAEAETLGGLTADEFVSGTQLETKVQQEVEAQVTLQTENVFSMNNNNTPTFRPSIFEGDNTTQIVLVDQAGSGNALTGTTAGKTALYGKATATTGVVFGVRGDSKSPQGIGVLGINSSKTGVGVGVRGQTAAPQGIGLVGAAFSTTGATTGIRATVLSPDGTALVVANKGSGKLLSGWANGAEQFSVQGDGTVTASAFVGDGSQLTGISVTGGDAETLDGLDSTEFARLNGGNAFTGAQTINGEFTVINTTGFGLKVIGRNIVGGSNSNTIANNLRGATISGGGGAERPNQVTGWWSTVSGGERNLAGEIRATVGGGGSNIASGPNSTISGGTRNKASSHHSTVGGGFKNISSGNASTAAGGAGNIASNQAATVGGGQVNKASGSSSTVAGGASNIASGTNSTIGGGSTNTASSNSSTVAGGGGNIANSLGATVGGGQVNKASGSHSTVPGGSANTALGDFSFAAGNHAKANHKGTFVWGDFMNFDIASTADNQFTARATGGFRFITAIDSDTGAPIATVEISAGTGTVTAPAFVGDGSGLTNLPLSPNPTNTVTIPWLWYIPVKDIPPDTEFGMRIDRVPTLPQGATIKMLRICGRDNDSVEADIGIILFRKPLRGGDVFAAGEVVASVNSGVTFAEDSNRCWETPVNILVENDQYFYYVEFVLNGPAQLTVAQLDY